MTDANTDGARMVAACTSGDEATVRELLRETPSLARQVPVGPLEARQRLALSEGPLRRALRESDLATIQRELRHDPSAVNTTDEDGNTPLHRAAQAEDTAESALFMKFLLDHGAALDVPNHLGFTPVYVTLFRNHPWTYARPRWGLFELLLARGAPYDINLASARGDIDAVRTLL